MIKSELIERIAERIPTLYKRDAEDIVDAILDEVIVALSRGDRVELRGFGAFSVRSRRARTGRNPRTDEQVMVSKKYVPRGRSTRAVSAITRLRLSTCSSTSQQYAASKLASANGSASPRAHWYRIASP